RPPGDGVVRRPRLLLSGRAAAGRRAGLSAVARHRSDRLVARGSPPERGMIATFDVDERAQLCDLLEELGPDAPTLLAPWTTHDLAAHLYLREHDYVAAPGLVVPGPWSRFAERRRQGVKQKNFDALVATIRRGPSGYFGIGWVRRGPNLNEFFVHHE